MKLATFDIFDTCLIRKCGKPEVVPYLMAHKLWSDDEMIRQEFVIARKQAAQKAGLNATIKDIYSQGVLNCFLNYSPDELMQAEMDMESEMLVANENPIPIKKLPKPVRKVLHNSFYNSSPLLGDRRANLSDSITLQTLQTLLRQEGWTIKFLSDMYLPSSFLESILIREGFISPLPNGGGEGGEAVIVSCEWGERKDTGGLYKKVKERYHPEKWIHFGDNLHSDYKQAKKNGVKAYLVDTSFTPIEKRIQSLGINSRHPETYSQLAGVMRYARLTSPSHYGEGLGERLEDLACTVLAADFIAPLYVSYVAFILKESKARGFKRLHFLSRDGFIMHEIAKAFNSEDIQLNYLFVSRKALTPAFLASDSKDNFLKITDRQHLIGRSVDFLLDSLRLNRVILEKKYGIKFKYNKILSLKQQEDFLNKVFDNKHIKEDLTEEFYKEKRKVLNYLSQEGLDDGKSQAMVDIGWLGTTRLMINEIISSNSPLPSNSYNSIPTFYIGVRNDVFPRSYGDFYSYFPLGSLSTESTGLIENYYSASPWPSTIGYASHPNHPLSGREADYPLKGGDKEEVTPMFKDGEEFWMTPIIETNVKVVTEIAKELKPYLEHFDEEILYQWAKITVESLSVMEFPIDLAPMAQATEFDGLPMIKKLTVVELLNMIFLGGRVSAFDRGSLSYTLGHRLSHYLWKIHEITGRLRSFLYRVQLRLKK